jgi:hypothetical protein
MCNLTGFVLVNAADNIAAHDLAPLSVQEVLLKIGFCGLVVVDDGSNFKGLFIAICDILSIDVHVAACGIHKTVGVKRFHQFLNKAAAIVSNDRGTNTIFVEAAHTAACAWHSSPIDGTDMIRSVPAIGWPFCFMFDLSFAPTPTPASNQASNAHAFLWLAGPTTAQLAEQVLRILTKEDQSLHRECANESCFTIAFAVGDLVMAPVKVNSDASTGTVAELSYPKCGPCETIQATGSGAYLVRCHDSPTAPLLKHPTQALSPLPPALLPCTPLTLPTSATSTIPILRFRTLSSLLSTSKCATMCGSHLLWPLIIRLCFNLPMSSTMLPLFQLCFHFRSCHFCSCRRCHPCLSC